MPKLTERQQLAVDYNEKNLLVSAAAGSGKTSVLVERLIGALNGGANIDGFLIITYTRAAALELRGRIQKEILKRCGENQGETKRLYAQLKRMHRANIGTIHAFCAGLLRDYAAEAGIKPNFKQLEGAEEAGFKQKALETALEELYGLNPPGFEVLAESLSGIGGDRRLGEVILTVYNKIQAFPNPDMMMDSIVGGHSDYIEYLRQSAERVLILAEKVVKKARRELLEMPELDAAYGAALDADLVNINALRNGLEITKVSARAPKGMAEAVKPFRDARDYFYKLLDEYQNTMLAAQPPAEDELHYSEELTRGLFAAVRAFGKAYGDLKSRKGVLDFSDLEHYTHNLLCVPGSRLEINFTEVMVDEYQDVNQVQEEIISALKSRVFMVGDARQSIYGFRLANPDIFLRKYGEWMPPEYGGDCGGARVVLPHNFRSNEKILNAVNAVFEKIMLGMPYGEEEKLKPPTGVEYGGELPVLVYCNDKSEQERDDEDTVPYNRVRLEAEMVADICAELVESGEKPDDIAVLLRAKSSMIHFKRAIEARGLPAAGQDDNIFETTEMRVAVTYLKILDNPRNDTALLAVMRSPLYNFSPKELVRIRGKAGGDFYDSLAASAAAGHSKCVRLLNDLSELRDLGTDNGMDLLYHTMLTRLGLLEIFGSMSGGETRRANLLSLIPIAAGAATAGELCRTLERRSASGKPPSAATQGGVNLMTVHKSKGLEFKTVIVADTARIFNRTDSREPILFHKDLGLGLKFTDAERRVQYTTSKREAVAKRLNEDLLKEEMRVLYVALTRAKERLFVTMTLPDLDARLKKLSLGLDGKPDEHRLLTCNSVSDWLLLALMNDGKPEDTWKVREYVHERPKTEVFGISSAECWQSPPLKAEREDGGADTPGKIPSKLTVTELSKTKADTVFAKPRFMEKHAALTAAERGTALHTALQFVNLRACGSVEGARTELECLEREQRMTREQIASVDPGRITRFVTSGLGARVLAAETVKRETPFSLLTPVRELLPEYDSEEKTLFQGVIDLMFIEGGEWVIVDFKSGASKPEYKRQLALYENAVRRVTGQRVKESLVYYV
ncbi:MAG: UvrD-helicase domain-containing protein [Oscillospiraceae bacterium]|nr:UvrD-helicase domain-containing protein [Oscillospiraceae bacterium]